MSWVRKGARSRWAANEIPDDQVRCEKAVSAAKRKIREVTYRHRELLMDREIEVLEEMDQVLGEMSRRLNEPPMPAED